MHDSFIFSVLFSNVQLYKSNLPLHYNVTEELLSLCQ